MTGADRIAAKARRFTFQPERRNPDAFRLLAKLAGLFRQPHAARAEQV